MKFSPFVDSFVEGRVKTWANSLKGFRSYGCLNLRGACCLKF